MKAKDARHGSVAGYRAGCREICCKKAISRYNERWKLNRIRGNPTSTYIDAIGSQRRLQALGALGWSITRIAQHAGIDKTYLRFVLRNSQRISADLADSINKVYDDLSMTLPPVTTPRERQGVTRTLKRAAALGWLPPLAYDDIDAGITESYADMNLDIDFEIDPVVVDRGVEEMDFRGSFNKEERAAVVQRWQRLDRSLSELARLSGWNVHRYTGPESDVAA